MRAKLINEKFEETSDPIHDLSIGKIDFSEAYRDIISPAEMEWDRYVEQFVGRTITGKMRQITFYGTTGVSGIQGANGVSGTTVTTNPIRIKGGGRGVYAPYSPGIQAVHSPLQGRLGIEHTANKKVKIVDYDAHIDTGQVFITGDDGNQYELLTEDELYIIE
jgi:hypothetical protein